MKKILLVYLPFCTPASPPYSITYLYSFLKNNCSEQVDVLDLNLEFHRLKFPGYQKYYSDSSNWGDYEQKTAGYTRLTAKTYSENNKRILNNEKPEFFDELLKKINDKKPDIVAFSIVYSSQAFYAYSLLKELKKDAKNIKTVIGGPAVNEKLVNAADKALGNEIELLDYIKNSDYIKKDYLKNHIKSDIKENPAEHGKLNCEIAPDFSIYNLGEYFTPKPVIPLKTSTTCYYKKCSFCSHFSMAQYYEYPLDTVKKTVIDSGQKYFFLIDDMIPPKRLLKIAEVFKPLNICWACQLRPTKEMDYKTLKTLWESGLIMIMWGVESGNQRILDLINKGTNVKDIEKVLEGSHNAGIKNIAYVIFGFPTETKDEFLETIGFLGKNEKNIDLVSMSIFGLQKGTAIYNNPKKFGITRVIEEGRTVLEPRISYEVENGLTQKEANQLREGYKKTIEKINKFPKTMNYFREHMLCFINE